VRSQILKKRSIPEYFPKLPFLSQVFSRILLDVLGVGICMLARFILIGMLTSAQPLDAEAASLIEQGIVGKEVQSPFLNLAYD